MNPIPLYNYASENNVDLVIVMKSPKFISDWPTAIRYQKDPKKELDNLRRDARRKAV